uniref:DUF834 domain-containing protein n=1 Tax=Setaria viridis TaxID=4556 RepID=A0A4V6DFQ8_SETVI|nr:hypothetical protein SEVIR_1G266000v2 [Setaria viridis]
MAAAGPHCLGSADLGGRGRQIHQWRLIGVGGVPRRWSLSGLRSGTAPAGSNGCGADGGGSDSSAIGDVRKETAVAQGGSSRVRPEEAAAARGRSSRAPPRESGGGVGNEQRARERDERRHA